LHDNIPWGGSVQRNPRRSAALGGCAGIAGILGFGAIVFALHGLQPAYDARRQLLSELALGPYGWTMGVAFVCLALSFLGAQFGLGALGASAAPRVLLGAAGAAMLAAGAFPLGRGTGIHIAAVLLGFALVAVAMYLLPARAGQLPVRGLRGVSWVLGTGAVASLASANCGVPIGVAQRLAVACVLGWLCWLSWRLVRG
jgi:hypothetical protein